MATEPKRTELKVKNFTFYDFSDEDKIKLNYFINIFELRSSKNRISFITIMKENEIYAVKLL